MTEQQPSEVLQAFLDYIDQIKDEYQSARKAVRKEDKRLQDLLHELEFAEDKAVRNRVATKFQRSRRERRRYKDEVQRLELLIDFFDSQNHKATINKMRNLLGAQRKREEYINGERHYKPRVEE
nr:MAG TPA: hypothetical protein [Bacteriophage sp.]